MIPIGLGLHGFNFKLSRLTMPNPRAEKGRKKCASGGSFQNWQRGMVFTGMAFSNLWLLLHSLATFLLKQYNLLGKSTNLLCSMVKLAKTCSFLRHFHWDHGGFLANHQIESVTVDCADLAGGTSCGSAGHVKELRWGSYRHIAYVIVAVGCGCACNGKPLAAKKLQDPRIGNDFTWYRPPQRPLLTQRTQSTSEHIRCCQFLTRNHRLFGISTIQQKHHIQPGRHVGIRTVTSTSPG